jgi:cysteine desulfurase
LESDGAIVDYLSVDSHGIVDLKELRKLITPETVLVSVMYANNEIGTIEPLRDIAKEIRHARKMNASSYLYFHTDAAQAANYLDLNVLSLGVDLMTLSSGKVYGPRGAGMLFVRRGVLLTPLFHGGEHEGGRRAGTEAVALVAGFAGALALAQKMKVKESMRVQKLRDAFAKMILKKIPSGVLNGGLEQTLPNILNISIPDIESEALVIYLDAAGVAVSGKSACKSFEGGPSHVIFAIGGVMEGEAGTIRFSLGRDTKNEDIVRTAKELSRIINFIRMMQSQGDHV